MVYLPSIKIPRVSMYSRSRLRSAIHFAYGTFTHSGPPSQTVRLCMTFLLRGAGKAAPQHLLQPRIHNAFTLTCIRFGLLPLSLAATGGISFDFLSCWYLDGSLPNVSPICIILFMHYVTGSSPAGLPHSDICGSPRVCQSPQFFAAYRVLLRLTAP